ncbi:endonuclease/exonuclease/phosphatase family protein [Pimelobacter simplex]|uniref:endonuclease/exonuclease/phosphatase family protein n=1 Tax=Nocardioides simplex TaxID=2045 RepID=UPI00215050ED|nr:endonuclease/exonuclease/phosphatase family protein [Pimelobacter simplex]UUW91293.1 endonuclease/exonuclease/phosphatase family protein [Pimelobacter simplex]UUW95121.1 endonuclease/exonuclease/phosphatase family protein [Pimelobacter simplex]
MTRTTRTPLALLLVAVLAISASLAALTTTPAQAADVAARKKPAPVGTVTLGDARISGSKANVPLSWRKAAGAKTYQVLWAPTRTMKKARSTTVRKRSATVRGLAVGKTWCFQVRGVAGKKKGKRSAPVCLRVAKPGQSKSPWVTKQSVAGGRAELTLTWRATAGARKYELDYAVTPLPVEKHKLWENKGRRTLTTSTNVGVLKGLLPNTIYCFQVRAITAGGASDRSPTHCKLTMPTNRSVAPANAGSLDAVTWNVCGGTADSCDGHGFNSRVAKIGSRIAKMNVDVAMLQETPAGSDTAVARAAGFTLGCGPSDGTGAAEAVLVRTNTYSIIDVGDRLLDPGACWVELENNASGHRVIVVSLHLTPGTDAEKVAERERQIREVLRWLPRRPGVPVVMGGDYNSSRSRDDDSPRPPLESAGFRDSYDIAAAYNSPTAANSMNRWNRTPQDSTLWGAHIDRVFSSSDTYVSSWQVVEPRGSDGRYIEPLSDHSPVKVTLRIPRSPS